MSSLNVEGIERDDLVLVAEKALPVLRQMRFLNEEYDPVEVTDINRYVEEIGARLRLVALTFDPVCITKNDDYAALLLDLVQHAGLVQCGLTVTSSLDREAGIASITCKTPNDIYVAEWKQRGDAVENAFFEFANLTLDAVGQRKHVRLPAQDQSTSLVCVSSDGFEALNEMMCFMASDQVGRAAA